MNEKLIEEYKDLARTCDQTDYTDKASVQAHNKAVKRMYEIITTMAATENGTTPPEYQTLLETSADRTNIWAAMQILERIPVDDTTQAKALAVIRAVAQSDHPDARAFGQWLQIWEKRQ